MTTMIEKVVERLQKFLETAMPQLPANIDAAEFTAVDPVEELKRLAKETSKSIVIHVSQPTVAEVRYVYKTKDGRIIVGEAFYFTDSWQREYVIDDVCGFASKAALIRRFADMALTAPDAFPMSNATLLYSPPMSVVLAGDLAYGYIGGRVWAGAGGIVFVLKDNRFLLTRATIEQLLKVVAGLSYKTYAEVKVDCVSRTLELLQSDEAQSLNPSSPFVQK